MFCISLVKERRADGCATYNMAVAKRSPTERRTGIVLISEGKISEKNLG